VLGNGLRARGERRELTRVGARGSRGGKQHASEVDGAWRGGGEAHSRRERERDCARCNSQRFAFVARRARERDAVGLAGAISAASTKDWARESGFVTGR